MLRSWRHNYGAVLRRSGNKRSRPAVAATTSSRKSSFADSSADAEVHAPVASESAIEAVPKKMAKVTKEPSEKKVRASAVPERLSQRSSVPPPPRFFIRTDLPQRRISHQQVALWPRQEGPGARPVLVVFALQSPPRLTWVYRFPRRRWLLQMVALWYRSLLGPLLLSCFVPVGLFRGCRAVRVAALAGAMSQWRRLS